MDSRWWLAGLGALTAALLIVLLVGARGGDAPAGGRVVPDFDVKAVESIIITRASGDGGLTLERDGDGWRMIQGWGDAPADPAAVRDLLGTVEMLAVRRRDDGRISEPAMRIGIDRTRAPRVELALAAPEGVTDRVWASLRGAEGRFLLDGYAARALDPDPAALRDTRPFRGRLRDPRRIEIESRGHRVALTGPPWRLEDGTRADPTVVRALLDDLDRLRLTTLGGRDPQGGSVTARVAVESAAGHTELALGGACEGGAVAVITSRVGPGCIARDVADALRARADPRGPMIDRRAIAAASDAVTIVRLRRGPRSITVTRDAQPDTLASWLDQVVAAATGGLTPIEPFAPLAEVELELDGGGREAFAVGRAAGGVLALRRAGEPVALALAPGSGALFDASPDRFRSLELISRDASDLSSASRGGGESIARGETLEEWRVLRPPGAVVDTAAADNLAASAAALHATRVAAPRAAPIHRFGAPRRTVDLVFDPAPGESAAERHTVELGADTAGGGCFARLDRDPVVFELSPVMCAALAGPWTRPRL